MHNILYLKQPEWGELGKGITEEQARTFFAGYAKSIGLDMEKFNADMAGTTYQDLIKQDVEAGLKAGAKATPTFYMNGKQVPDPSYETLKKYFEEAKAATN
jgi:protein-disulfide isomerase